MELRILVKNERLRKGKGKEKRLLKKNSSKNQLDTIDKSTPRTKGLLKIRVAHGLPKKTLFGWCFFSLGFKKASYIVIIFFVYSKACCKYPHTNQDPTQHYRIYKYLYTYIHIYTYMYTYIYISDIHTYIHACIHTYVHTYITYHYITLHYLTLHYIALHYITLI